MSLTTASRSLFQLASGLLRQFLVFRNFHSPTTIFQIIIFVTNVFSFFNFGSKDFSRFWNLDLGGILPQKPADKAEICHGAWPGIPGKRSNRIFYFPKVLCVRALATLSNKKQ